MLNVKPTKNKILLGIVRFISFAIVLQIFREVTFNTMTDGMKQGVSANPSSQKLDVFDDSSSKS